MVQTGSGRGDAPLWRHWSEALEREAVVRALTALYDEVDAAVAAREPTCWMSGKCCDFDAYGHRLYVTGLEIAWCVRRLARVAVSGDGAASGAANGSASHRLPQSTDGDLSGPCVFQQKRMCGIHAVRPFSCRMFFCQQGTEDWQHETYERFLNQLRRLHEDEGVAYRYMEWRAGLAEAIPVLGTALGD